MSKFLSPRFIVLSLFAITLSALTVTANRSPGWASLFSSGSVSAESSVVDIHGGKAIFSASQVPQRSGASNLLFASTYFVRTDGSDTLCNGLTNSSAAGAPNCAFLTIQKGILAAANGDTIRVAAGTYTEIGQVLINESLTIVGEDKATTIVKPAQDTGNESSGDARGWFLIGNPGDTAGTFNMSGVTLDGATKNICHGVYDYYAGTIEDINVKNIGCSIYYGRGIYLKNNATVRGVRLENIRRIGIFIWQGASAAIIDGNTYIGKGAGDHLDYGIELNNGGGATITNNTISGNIGEALSDGSDSAGIFVSTANGPGTQATITGNTLTGNTTAIYVGQDGTDTSVVTAHFNRIVGNGTGIFNKAPAVDAENNWWGCNTGPGTAGCDSVSGPAAALVDYNPWIQLRTTANPTTVPAMGTSTITADMRFNSDGVDTSVSSITVPDPGTIPLTPVAFSATNGTMSPTNSTITNGFATSTFTSNAPNSTSASACSSVDNSGAVCTAITVVPQADLSVTKADSPDPVFAGQNITYAIGLANNGPSTAQNVSLTDNLPANTTFVSAQQTSGPAFTLTTPAVGGIGTVTATNASVLSGATATFQIVVNVNASTPDGSTITNTASVTSGTNDHVLGNNSATAFTTVDTLSDLNVNKDDGVTEVTPGGSTTYTVTVNNFGPSDAVGATVTDAMPAGVSSMGWSCSGTAGSSCVANGSGSINQTVNILAGGSVTFTISANIAANASGNITNTATAAVAAGSIDPNPSNDSDQDVDAVVVAISGNIKQFVQGGPNTNLSGVTVTLTGSSAQTTTTDGIGNYAFNSLPAGGSFVVTPSSGSKVFDPTARTYNALFTNITNANFLAYTNQAAVPRVLSVVNAYATPGQAVVVPINVMSQGTESKYSFSLTFDTNFLSAPTVTCGSSAPGCTIVPDTTQAGEIGITVTPAGPLAPGLREIAKVTFQTFANSVSNTPVNFGSSPTGQSVVDSGNNPLPANYTNGFVVFAQGKEGDVAPAPTGNGIVDGPDVDRMANIVVGSSPLDPNFNEFQRADAAPRAGSGGNAVIDASDLQQVIRYSLNLDTSQGALGPGETPKPALTKPVSIDQSKALRELGIPETTGYAGQKLGVPVAFTSQGDEVAASFTLEYDAMKLANPTVTLGSGAPQGAILTFNSNESGRVSILVYSANAFNQANAGEMVRVTFDVAANAPEGDTTISINTTEGSVTNTNADALLTRKSNGKVSISGAASLGADITGRVATSDGTGLRNATVTITDANGTQRTVMTGSQGYYSFDSVGTNRVYTITVTSKRFRFASRKIELTDSLADLDFTAQD